MAKEILRLISSVAMLVAVIVGVRYAMKLIDQVRSEDIIDI